MQGIALPICIKFWVDFGKPKFWRNCLKILSLMYSIYY